MRIVACIDGSDLAQPVCEAAAWAHQRLEVPVVLLHALEKGVMPARADLSGAIGLGSQEHLLDELTALEEQRQRLELQHGKAMLKAAEAHLNSRGVTGVTLLQRHTSLLEALQEQADQTALVILGRRGEDHAAAPVALGSHVETVVRGLHVPILMMTGPFRTPERIMVAYDGSEQGDALVERLADHGWARGLSATVVMVGEDSDARMARLERAVDRLQEGGIYARGELLGGDVEDALITWQLAHTPDLMVMGAYGHSRIRQWLVGSHTTRMLMTSRVPLLILR